MTFKNMITGILLSLLCVSYSANAQPEEGTKKELTQKQQGLISIAAYTAQGDLINLESALNQGLDEGLTVNEIKEALIHLYAYAGFPRSIRGLQTFMSVLEERKASGIKDAQGPEASPISEEPSKYERGKAVLEELVQAPLDGPQSGYAAFAPTIEVFLKEHLFADLFERDVLTYEQRELVTISVLSSIGKVEPMLKSHFNICLNLGLTPGQLLHFTKIIGSTIGEKEAKAAESVLNEVLEERK